MKALTAIATLLFLSSGAHAEQSLVCTGAPHRVDMYISEFEAKATVGPNSFDRCDRDLTSKDTLSLSCRNVDRSSYQFADFRLKIKNGKIIGGSVRYSVGGSIYGDYTVEDGEIIRIQCK